MPLVTSGVEHGNLRELALERMKDLGTEVRLNCAIKLSYSCICNGHLVDPSEMDLC